jgi:hypothetical protein
VLRRKPDEAIPSSVPALTALVALTAVSAVAAESARPARGTLPSLDSLICLPVRVSYFSFGPAIVPFLITLPLIWTAA